MGKLIISLLLGLVSSARAQVVTTGQIVGSVQDSRARLFRGATLRLENENTREVQTTRALTAA